MLQTTQIIPDVCFITDYVAYASSNKTKIVRINTEIFCFFFTRGGCASCLRACLGARLLPQSYQYPNLSEGADRVGGQMRGDKECPFSGLTKSGRVWRKVRKAVLRVWLGVLPAGRPSILALCKQSTYPSGFTVLYRVPGEIKRREMELDPHVSPEEIMSREVVLGCESWTSFASSFSSTAVQRTWSL